jgi:hypothetical protein
MGRKCCQKSVCGGSRGLVAAEASHWDHARMVCAGGGPMERNGRRGHSDC